MAYPMAAARGGRMIRTAGNGLLSGLRAFWPMNEAGGANNALDLVGGYTWTQVNAPGADTGLVYPTARSFDGGVSAQYFTRAYNAGFASLFGDTDHTVTLWAYHTIWATNPPLLYRFMFACGESTVGGLACLTNAGHQVVGNWYNSGAGGVTSTHGESLADLNTWHLLQFAWDAANSKGRVAVNLGAWADLAESGTHGAATYGSAYIGQFGSSNWFAGRLGPIMVWNRLLSDIERAALYNDGAGLQLSGFTA